MHIRFGTGIVFACMCLSVGAQWTNQPTPGAPRTPDGKLDMTGAVLRVIAEADSNIHVGLNRGWFAGSAAS